MKYLGLFSNCIPVKGASRSIICDLQRNNYEFIPNSLYEILLNFRGKTRKEIEHNFSSEDKLILNDYFQFLEEKEFIFWTESPDLFPEIDDTFYSPSIISNAIIDVDDSSSFSFDKISNQLDELGCKALNLRFFCDKKIDEINSVLKHFQLSKLRSIDILIKFNLNNTLDEFKNIHFENPRISSISIHSSEENKIDFINLEKTIPIYYTKEKITDCSACGKINPSYFSFEMRSFFESKNNNSCLNKKISIDVNGNIKNCPSMKDSYGNIENNLLIDSLNSKSFKEKWKINKDEIKVCQDCEFRYVCTDCRVYVDDKEDMYSHPSKCTYNPYLGLWKGEEGYVSISEKTID